MIEEVQRAAGFLLDKLQLVFVKLAKFCDKLTRKIPQQANELAMVAHT